MSNSRLSIVVKAVCMAIIIFAGICGIAFFKASVCGLLLFFLYILVYIMIPGLFIEDVISNKEDRVSTHLARGFFLGWVFIIACYFAADILEAVAILYAAGPIITVIYVVRYAKRNSNSDIRKRIKRIKKLPSSVYLFVLIVFLLSMTSTQFDYISPAYCDYSYLQIDRAYHAGIINSLAQGYPVENPWVHERLMSYHIFTELLYAIPVKLFGLTSDFVLMSCSPYLITSVFTVSLYSFYREMVKRVDRLGLYCIGFASANMCMFKAFAVSYAGHHIYSNINSFGLGICVVFVLIPMLKVLNSVDKTKVREIAVFAVLIMLLTGIKGPIGVTIIAGLWGTVVLGIVLRRISLRAIIPVAVFSTAFIAIYCAFMGGSGGSSGNSIISLGKVAEIFFLNDEIVIPLKVLGVNVAIRKAVLLFVITTCMYMAFLVPFAVGTIREIVLVLSGKREFAVERVTVYACAIVGYVALLIFDYSGHSQVYFGFVSTSLAPIIAFWLFEDISDSTRIWKKTVCGIFAVMMTISSLLFTYDLVNQTKEAIKNYKYRNEELHDCYRDITKGEYEAMMWLRNNTPQEALIVSDRYSSCAINEYDYTNRWHNCHFLYAAYSERFQYLEGSGFSLGESENNLRRKMIDINNSFYDAENESRGDEARRIGVDYVVVSKRFNNPGNLENEDYKKCFENEDIDIYQIQ